MSSAGRPMTHATFKRSVITEQSVELDSRESTPEYFQEVVETAEIEMVDYKQLIISRLRLESESASFQLLPRASDTDSRDNRLSTGSSFG